MATVDNTEVVVVGAGPVGLMAAIELRRRGVDVMIVDKRLDIAPWAKAVGVQPRTLEIWDAMGIARPMLDRATSMRGQLVYVNGEQTGRVDFVLPDDVPYRFAAIPQYAAEEVLGEHLAGLGTRVRRGVEALGYTAGADGVTVRLSESGSPTKTFEVFAQYLIGADGAHSMVRKTAGLAFEGDAFPEEYMLADVELDWNLPHTYGVRSMHQTDGVTDDLLVCIPLPGRRYRVSMLVPDELSARGQDSDAVAHGIQSGPAKPQLRHIQAVLDRLAPEPVTASDMRWSSVFRISHRLVQRYSAGRVFLAGDAAHIHPPTGAQGMNTGLQDAYNLGWKLALAVRGVAAPGLLDSYHAERHPVGSEVVGRTVRAARHGIGAGETSMATVFLREAQLLVGYPDSPIVAADGAGFEPGAGMRAPDAAGLRQPTMAFAMRWHELLRHPGHTLLLWAPTAGEVELARGAGATATRRSAGWVRSYIVVPAEVVADISGNVFADSQGNVARAYGFGDVSGVCLVRPDGYVGYRSRGLDAAGLLEHLGATTMLVS